MNNRKFKSDKAALIQEGKRIANTTEDGKYIRKVTLVNLMLAGTPASEIGEAAGETPRTLTLWMKSVDERGFDSLKPMKQPGKHSRLSEIQKDR